MDDFFIKYSGYLLALISIFAAIFQFRAKRKSDLEKIEIQKNHEKEVAKQKIKYETYREYLGKLDEINGNFINNITNEDMQLAMHEMFDKVFLNPDDVDAIKEYVLKANSFFGDWAQQQYKFMEELNGLRLVCSKEILDLLDEYEDFAKNYIEDVSTMMEVSNFLENVRNPLKTTSKDKTNYQKMIDLKKQIEQLMRKDIGI